MIAVAVLFGIIVFGIARAYIQHKRAEETARYYRNR